MAKPPVQYLATGRRKTATARVFLRPGTGKVTINRRDGSEYLHRAVLDMVVKQPLVLISQPEWDILVNVRGGGKAGQAEAIRLGLARALVTFNPELRPALKHAGFLTRDGRKVERKKYGRAGARRRFQFSKR